MISHIYSGGSLLFHHFLFEQEKDLTVFLFHQRRDLLFSLSLREVQR